MVIVLLLGCTSPGVRARGDGAVRLRGSGTLAVVGPCDYNVRTRWSSRLPHVITWRDSSSARRLVVQLRGRPRPGSQALAPVTGRQTAMALFMDGSLVRGAVEGELRIAGRGDTTDVAIAGTIRHRDTFDVDGTCRLIARPPAG